MSIPHRRSISRISRLLLSSRVEAVFPAPDHIFGYLNPERSHPSDEIHILHLNPIQKLSLLPVRGCIPPLILYIATLLVLPLLPSVVESLALCTLPPVFNTPADVLPLLPSLLSTLFSGLGTFSIQHPGAVFSIWFWAVLTAWFIILLSVFELAYEYTLLEVDREQVVFLKVSSEMALLAAACRAPNETSARRRI